MMGVEVKGCSNYEMANSANSVNSSSNNSDGTVEGAAGDVAGVKAHVKGQTPCQPLSPHYYGVTVDTS